LHELDEARPGVSLPLRVDTFVETVRRWERRALSAGGPGADRRSNVERRPSP